MSSFYLSVFLVFQALISLWIRRLQSLWAQGAVLGKFPRAENCPDFPTFLYFLLPPRCCVFSPLQRWVLLFLSSRLSFFFPARAHGRASRSFLPRSSCTRLPSPPFFSLFCPALKGSSSPFPSFFPSFCPIHPVNSIFGLGSARFPPCCAFLLRTRTPGFFFHIIGFVFFSFFSLPLETRLILLIFGVSGTVPPRIGVLETFPPPKVCLFSFPWEDVNPNPLLFCDSRRFSCLF